MAGNNRPIWFAIRQPLSPRRATIVKFGSFLLPLVLWCLVSYVPFIWHPMIQITDPGDSDYLTAGQQLTRQELVEENSKLLAAKQQPAVGYRANPFYFPAPHEVARAFYLAFTTPPSNGDPWLHQSLWHSITIIFWGFTTSAIIGVPLGILCGTFNTFSKLFEPLIDFIRYMPAPAFGMVCVAILGIDDGPKIAIIWIGTFFQMVLVVANTTRLLDGGLLEAAQTLGASRARMMSRVILPGILPNLYTDMRILIGWAWTYLIVAELIGASSGISYFINQQSKHFHYDNVYAGIMMIGIIGLVFDQMLALFGRYLFPWIPGNQVGPVSNAIFSALTLRPQRAVFARWRERVRSRSVARSVLAPAVVRETKRAVVTNDQPVMSHSASDNERGLDVPAA